MVIALFRTVCTRLGLSLFKTKHVCHGTGFEVQKQLDLPRLEAAQLQTPHLASLGGSCCFLPEPGCSCEDGFRSHVSLCLEEQRHQVFLEHDRRAGPVSEASVEKMVLLRRPASAAALLCEQNCLGLAVVKAGCILQQSCGKV